MSNIIQGSALEDQLNFYRQKMTQHENERFEWQEQSDLMRQQIERTHNAERTADFLKEQIAELQKALSDSHLAIYEEKSNNL